MTTERDRINQLAFSHDKGVEEGSMQKAMEIARKMLASDVDFAKIMEFTGLSEDEVRSLKI